MRHRNKWCHIAGFALGMIVVMPVLIMLGDRREPLELISGSIRPNDAKAGQEVRVTWTAQEFRPCDGELYRIFIDSSKTVYPTVVEPTVYHKTFADQRTFQKVMIVPAGMTPGPAIYTTAIERWCNPLQKYIWPIRSEGLQIQFNVIE